MTPQATAQVVGLPAGADVTRTRSGRAPAGASAQGRQPVGEGGVAGNSPLEGVAEDAQRLERGGGLSPQTNKPGSAAGSSCRANEQSPVEQDRIAVLADTDPFVPAMNARQIVAA
jgi:hypothetical protein